MSPAPKCVSCGRFIALREMATAKAKFRHTPDNAFGAEKIEWLCEQCDQSHFDTWIERLNKEVVEREYGYEPGEFAVYPELWRGLYDEGLSPIDAFKRALGEHDNFSNPEEVI